MNALDQEVTSIDEACALGSQPCDSNDQKEPMMTEMKQCFVIAPIGEDESDTRKRSDKVLRHIIVPVVEPLGYQPVRADQIAEPGLITSQVIQHVADDPLVIADLTDRNPNVFYELAIRHVLRKPLVQLVAKGERIPFDVAGMRTIEVDIGDLDNVDDAKNELAKQIKAAESDPGALDTPISFAFELSELRQSGNPEERSLADLVTAMSDVRSSLANLERRIRDPEELLPPGYIDHVFRRQRRDGALADPYFRQTLARTEAALVGLLDEVKNEEQRSQVINTLTLVSNARERIEE